MATVPSSESRRRYSWWWDSHISPKNSRWLQDNLTDMDMKVKAMIKLIEEDADSFARRAEMYYKKRPELMKLVEEFYRAYRALAERYDQATGALRQAHRTMTEAFPNQVPLMSPDESPYASSNNDMEPHTPEVPPPVRAFFGPEDLPKDTSGLSSDFHAISRNGAYSEDNNSIPSKRGLKQLNEMFASGEARVKKGLNFVEEDGEFDNKGRKGSREPQKIREKQDINVIKDLQQDVSRLSTENQNLKTQVMEESDRANKAESEIQSLKDRLSQLNSQKDEDLLQYQRSLERISSLESQLSNAQNEMQKLKSDILNEAHKLSNIEELNRSLQLELEMLEKKTKKQEHELKLKEDEFNEVTVTLQEKKQQCMEAQMALCAKEKLLIESQEEVKLLNLEIQKWMEKLRDVQLSEGNLQEEICKLKEETDNLKEVNLNSSLLIKDLQEETILLKDKHQKLTEEVDFHKREKEILDQELCQLKEGRGVLERRHQELVKKMETITLNSESLQVTIKELQTENFELKENCKTGEAEKELLMEKLEDMGKISERNKILENSLSELNMEFEVQKEKNLTLNGSLESLNHELSTCISEMDSLVSQFEILTQNLKILSDKNNFLENTLSDTKLEVHELKGKVKDFEKSCQTLEDQNCIQRDTISALNHSYESLNLELSTCISERDSLVSHLGNLTNDMENLSEKNNFLDNALTHANSQVDQLKTKLGDSEASCQYLKDQNFIQRDKIAALDASHESLNLELSTRISERESLTSQLEILTQNGENLSEKNKLLEIALSNANAEGRELKGKMKDLEESCQSLKDQNCVHRETITALSDLNEHLNLELSTCTTERDSVISQLEIVTQNMENLSGKNNLLENMMSDAKSEVAELKGKLKDLEESHKSLKGKLKDLEESYKSLKDQNCAQVEKIASLNESQESLNLELSNSIVEKDSFVSQLEILTQNVGHLSEKKNFLENALSDAKSEVGELKEKVKDLEESCQSLKDQNYTQSEKIASLNDSHESLNRELSTCITERDSFVSQLEIVTQNVGNLSEKNDFLENALSDAKSEVGELKAKVKGLKEYCQSLQNQNCTQSEKIELLNVSHESLNLELSTCIVERDSFASQLEILTQSMGNLSEKNNFLENALSDAKSEVGELKAKVKDLDESCQALKDQNCVQSENIASLNGSHESLNLELSTCIAERDSFASQLEILTQTVGYLSENKNFLENALSDAKSEVGELKEKVKDLEESCQSLKDQNCTQSEKIASLSDSHESLNVELSNHIAERDAVVSQLVVLTQSVENLSENNILLENAISDAKSELGELKVKQKNSEESCQSLKDQNCTQSKIILALNDLHDSLNLELSTRIAERDSLLSQLEILNQTVENLSEKNNILGSAFSEAKSEVVELKEKLNNFEQSCQSLKDQNFNLREKNAVLNDSCESLNLELSNTIAERDSVVSQLEILTLNVDNLSEKNDFLETALSDAKNEVGGLKEKLEESEKSCQSLEEQNHIQVKKFATLNNSYESLNLELSTCITERDSVISKLEIFTKNVEHLSKKNNILENTLYVATFEVEELKAKMKDFEESCQSIKDENRRLLAEKNALTSQVQSITSSLDDLGSMLAELQDRHSSLTSERDLSINQINELEILLKLEKEEYTKVNQSYKAQVTNLENMISLLQEENLLKHKELEEEQNKSVAAMVEMFILQTTLSEAHQRNLNLSLKAQKHLEDCRKAEELVSQLEQEISIQVSKLLSLTKHNEKLSQGIRLFSNTLLANKGPQLIDDIHDDALLDIVIVEIRKLLSFISENDCENQQLHLQISILVTLLRHTALDMVNLRSERCHLEKELEDKAEEISSFENKHAELLRLNAQLTKNYEYNIQREEAMKAEKEALFIQLCNLQEALQTSTVERLELMEENEALSVEVCNLKQKHIEFEKEHTEILQEAMKQCHHHFFFKSLSSERLAELKSLSSLNEHLMESIETSRQREELLKAELSVFSTQLNALHKSLQESEDRILKLIEEKEALSDEFCKLERKHNDSEVKNIEILAESMRLEHLYLYFKNLSAERLTELKSYSGLNEHLMENIEANMQREKLLSAEIGSLSVQLNRLQESFQASQNQNLMLIQEKNALSEEFHNLKKKHYDLEEEHIDVLAETIKLDHLHLFFKSLSLETLLVLKSSNCDLAFLRSVKSNLDDEIVKLNGAIGIVKLENMQLTDSMTCLEELKDTLLDLEFDLNNARSFYDELYLQSENLTNELIQKETQLSEANERVKSTDEKNVELFRLLQDVQLQIEESKLVKEELERKNLKLTEAVSQKNGDIRCLHEANEIMQKEIDKINEEVEVLRTRETHLLTELQKQTNEVDRCDLEIDALLSEIHILTVNAAIYKEKAHEVTLEGEIRYMVEKHILTMEATLIRDHVDVAKKLFNDLEEQIKGLVAETTSLHIPEVTSDLNALNCNERNDISLEPHQQHCNDRQPRAGHKSMSTAGVLELEQFIAKADALQKMIMNVRVILKQERFDCNSNLAAARKDAKGVQLRTLDGQTDIQASKNFSMSLDVDGVKNEDISKDKFGQMMKDIQLDQASSSSHYIDDASNGQHVSGNSEIDDQLWEAAERECHDQSQKVSEVDVEHDIETVEEEKSEYPSSELLPEKELNVDMLGTLKKHLLSKQEWNKKIVERLDSDAVRLSDIKTSVEELERKMESSPMGKLPPNFGYDTIKAQLKEAEANVLELIDVNSNLAKNVASSNGIDNKHGEQGSTRRRQISEDARKTSEKVGRLELELQKIQYILLKLEEEHENKRSKAIHRRSRVLLRDFLYGRKDNRRLTKKSCFCGCMRPKTNDDH